MRDKWTSKVDALVRLAEDQRGTPEGDLAREKLASILRKHPEVCRYQPVVTLAERDLTLADIGKMKREGISLEGTWVGTDLQDAVRVMEDEYKRRIAEVFVVPKKLIKGGNDETVQEE